jgi:hypothetical protein
LGEAIRAVRIGRGELTRWSRCAAPGLMFQHVDAAVGDPRHLHPTKVYLAAISAKQLQSKV